MIGSNNHTHGFAQESQCTLDHVNEGYIHEFYLTEIYKCRKLFKNCFLLYGHLHK